MCKAKEGMTLVEESVRLGERERWCYGIAIR